MTDEKRKSAMTMVNQAVKSGLSQTLCAATIALALAGCLECRPGDATTTNGRDLCPQHGEHHGGTP